VQQSDARWVSHSERQRRRNVETESAVDRGGEAAGLGRRCRCEQQGLRRRARENPDAEGTRERGDINQTCLAFIRNHSTFNEFKELEVAHTCAVPAGAGAVQGESESSGVDAHDRKGTADGAES
jgi:hypothetical protein